MIDAGNLDRKLTLAAPSSTRSPTGQVKDTWTDLATVPAERLELRTADVARGAGKAAVPEGKYRIRWRSGVTTKMRARIDGITYSITAIDEPDRRQSLILILEGL